MKPSVNFNLKEGIVRGNKPHVETKNLNFQFQFFRFTPACFLVYRPNHDYLHCLSHAENPRILAVANQNKTLKFKLRNAGVGV